MPVIIATGYAELSPRATRGFPRLSKPYTQQQLAEALASAYPANHRKNEFFITPMLSEAPMRTGLSGLV
jgi:hypothetical protein